uniref:Uncharacterized protein n=1 Tax=Octopus bimaculoides TaxID=37653 RepID=A0A0L8FRF2_OCTBM
MRRSRMLCTFHGKSTQATRLYRSYTKIFKKCKILAREKFSPHCEVGILN